MSAFARGMIGWAWLTLLAATAPAWAVDGAGAGGWVASADSRARLVWCAGPTGSPSNVATLEMQLGPGWKTYWRVPGDAGVAPEFEFAGSSNVASASVLFPAPHRLPDGDGEAIGYKTAVVFPVRIVRRDATKPASVVVTANYGICKNICVPVEVKLTGTCEDAKAAALSAADALAKVPRDAVQHLPGDPELLGVSGSVTSIAPQLVIDVRYGAGATDTDLFIEAPEGLYVPQPKRAVAALAGSVRYIVDLSKVVDAKDLLGKQLRLTMITGQGGAEALWTAR